VALILLLLAQPVAAHHRNGSPHNADGFASIYDGGGVTTNAERGYAATHSAATSNPGSMSAAHLDAGHGRPVALIPHSCVPVSSGGVDLSYVFTEGAPGDCASFSAPVPLAAQGSGRGGIAVTPAELAGIAIDQAMALAERPQVEIAPSRVGLTGLPSFFWLAREPQRASATATVPGLAVTAEAYPVQYVWEFGDGTTDVTAHHGRRWTRRRPGSIRHTYETRARYEVVVEVIWQARWRVNSGAWQPLGYFTTESSVAYPVRQVASVLVRGRDRR